MRSIARAIIGVLAAALAGCGDGGGSNKPATEVPTQRAQPLAAVAPPPAPALALTSVTRTVIAEPVTGTGSIFAVRTTDIGPSVDGVIETVMVRVGDVVKKGQPLFKTRDADARLTVQELERQLALARAQLRQAQSDLGRQDKLRGGGWVSASRMDAIRTSAEVAAAQAGVWEARLAQARQHLSDTLVRAPYDGVITRRDVDEGRFMATRIPGGQGGGGGVVQIMQIDTVAAIVQTPERYLGLLKTGMPVTVRIDSVGGDFKTQVRVINHRLDLATRTVEVRMALPNPDFRIRPGLFCRAEFATEGRSVLTVDARAVFGPEGARYAFLARDGRARRVRLSVRPLADGRLEILSNVPEGTKFLMGPGAESLTDGSAFALPGASG
jgi:RND family efflux transporter MFP subunit